MRHFDRIIKEYRTLPIAGLVGMIVLALVYVIVFVQKSYIGVPFLDGFLGLPIVDKFYSGSLHISDFFKVYGEHTIFLYYLVGLANGVFFKYNMLVDSYVFIFSFLLSSLILIYYCHKKLANIYLFYGVAFLMVIINFSLVQPPLVFMSCQFAFSTCIMLIIALLVDKYYEDLSCKAFILLVALFPCYIFLFAGGYAVGAYGSIAFIICLKIIDQTEKRARYKNIVLFTIITIELLLYWLFITSNNGNPVSDPLSDVIFLYIKNNGLAGFVLLLIKITAAGFAASVMNNHFMLDYLKNLDVVFYIGLFLLIISFITSCLYLKLRLYRKSIFPLFLMIYPFPISIITTLSRLNAPGGGWMWPTSEWYSFHYKFYLIAVILMVAMIYDYLLRNYSKWLLCKRSIRAIIGTLLAVFVGIGLLFQIATNIYMWQLSPSLRGYYNSKLVLLKSDSEDAYKKLYVGQEELKEYKSIMEKYQLNIYNNKFADDYQIANPQQQTLVVPSYKFGTVLSFTATGNANPYKGNGWSTPDKDFTWTDGNKAVLLFSIGETDKDLTLNIKTGGFIVPGKLDKQTVNVLANGQQIAKWEFTKMEAIEQSAIIPKNILEKGKLTIEFELPNATSPVSLGINQDMRALSLDVVNLSIGNQTSVPQ